MDASPSDAVKNVPAGPAGVYLHIPFCRAKCAYCDFASFAGLEALYGRYLAALLHEMERCAACEMKGSSRNKEQAAKDTFRDWLALGFDTLFVGGGTPTALPAAELARLLQAGQRRLALAPTAEISIEVNPGAVSLADLLALREAGYNRLSLGIQSLRDDELALLGRIHTSEEAVQSYRWAREAGFANVNLDLIYGLPRQTLAQWRESLERALELGPEHLSLYALSVEAGTPLQTRISRGALPAPDDAAAANMYERAQELLDRAGYAHYEISNWARRGPGDAASKPGSSQPEFGRWRTSAPAAPPFARARAEPWPSPDMPALACRHNLKYWRNLPYLGLGSAACSYDGRCRRGNVIRPQEYIERVEAGRDAMAEEECLNRDRHMDETMMLGLRLIEGVSRAEFARRFGLELEDVYGAEMAELVGEGLLEADQRGIRLTPRGRLLGNHVFAAFLRETDGTRMNADAHGS